MKYRFYKYRDHLLVKKDKNFFEACLIGFYRLYVHMKGSFGRNQNPQVSRLFLTSRNIKRNLLHNRYFFVAVDDLVLWTTDWMKTFTETYDIIIGIPRSGLLVANIIALKLGKPLSTPDLFCNKHTWISKSVKSIDQLKKILLVDDSMYSGKSLQDACNMLKACNPSLDITTAALIVTNNTQTSVDIYHKVLPKKRLFEWNILHSKKGSIASDLDGVICENCPPGYDSNEDTYREWIKTAKHYCIPSFEIDVIISCRLEHYRKDTEEWLNRHGVKYKKLVLWNLDSKNERKGQNARYKVKELLSIKPDFFWESSLAESEYIWEKTKIPTLCFDEMRLFS